MVSVSGVMAQAVTKQITAMSDYEFDQKFRLLSKTDNFSTVASGVNDPVALNSVREQLKAAGIGREWTVPLTDFAVRAAVRAITKRIVHEGARPI